MSLKRHTCLKYINQSLYNGYYYDCIAGKNQKNRKILKTAIKWKKSNGNNIQNIQIAESTMKNMARI